MGRFRWGSRYGYIYPIEHCVGQSLEDFAGATDEE